ncbi:MAG: aspartate aminotransferase family protein [Bryobacteraceae bacterium]|nr:aspartate aminotransferase family protein [Bryobacteraceae bacterium]
MTEKYVASIELLKRARQSLAGGVSSPFRAKFPVPLYFRHGYGSRLFDEDGNEYIDYALAWGPAILGHCHPRLVEALAEQARRPATYGAQHRLEIEVAERIQAAVPCAERLIFTSSGSEAVQCALRLARACTGRNLVLKFEGHYHGWFDSVLLSHHPRAEEVGPAEAPRVAPESKGQVPNAADNVVVLPWNRADLVASLFEERRREIAAVIMEPVLCNSGCLLPLPGYLEQIREIAHRNGALLILDEIITGFRIAPGGAQSYYNVVPDLATFGKAVGAGLPLSVIAGRREIMDLMFTGGVSYGGSFNGNPVSLTGGKVALDELTRDGGAALKQANELGGRIRDGIAEAAARYRIPATLCGFGAAFAIHFTRTEELTDYRATLDDNRERLAEFVRAAMDEGVYLLPDGRFYVSVVHTEEDARLTLDAMDRVFARMSRQMES